MRRCAAAGGVQTVRLRELVLGAAGAGGLAAWGALVPGGGLVLDHHGGASTLNIARTS